MNRKTLSILFGAITLIAPGAIAQIINPNIISLPIAPATNYQTGDSMRWGAGSWAGDAYARRDIAIPAGKILVIDSYTVSCLAFAGEICEATLTAGLATATTYPVNFQVTTNTDGTRLYRFSQAAHLYASGTVSLFFHHTLTGSPQEYPIAYSIVGKLVDANAYYTTGGSVKWGASSWVGQAYARKDITIPAGKTLVIDTITLSCLTNAGDTCDATLTAGLTVPATNHPINLPMIVFADGTRMFRTSQAFPAYATGTLSIQFHHFLTGGPQEYPLAYTIVGLLEDTN